MNKAATVLGALALLALCACDVGTALCQKKKECNDEIEDDSVRVCIEAYHTKIDALRANDEEQCHKLADATLALDACRATLKCDDFTESDLGQECTDEQDDFADKLDRAFGQCAQDD